MPCLASASSPRQAQEPILIERATGEEQATKGQGEYLESGWDCSLGWNTDDEEEDTGKARARIKLNLAEASCCEGKSTERAGRETPLGRDGVQRENGDCLEKRAGKT